jgi:ferredoxin, 2Fe-2S
MPKITYIEPDGTTHAVMANVGSTVMECATKNGIPGIDATCGGACACATCHVYVDEAWRAIVGEPNDMERCTLDFVSHPGPGSRLSCQISVIEDLDGLIVRIPVSQG